MDLLETYRLLYLVRHVEEEIAARYHKEERMRCPTHLSIGQESAAVGVMMALKPEDRVYSTHRCHAHYLAKGGDVDAMIAELYGKDTGCAGGWGGSMHLVDESVNFMGTSAIVGSSVGIAIGSAMAAKMERSDRASVAFGGDAVPETGIFWESVSFAALMRLPILFVCENNLYATSTSLNARQPTSPVTARVAGFGLPTFHCDDTDVIDVYEKAAQARAQLPAFMEIATYRYLEHVGPNPDWDQGYRTRREVEERMASDPVKLFRSKLVAKGYAGKIAVMEATIVAQTAAAFERAEAAPWPDVSEMTA
ncbi:MAG: thiamine pyrophosphate-dependent dehydrogenase E1 component subunit alpha [Chloroflexi bacterium]|nr:thiamine pyrophosphate-dependent dehydrogenase E1 component subunit alpha [Chloroflexota bacterium]